MSALLLILILALILWLGHWRLASEQRKLKETMAFLIKYQRSLGQMAQHYFGTYPKKLDPELYQWLTLNVSKAQDDLGIFGILDVTAPFNRYHVKNMQYIINKLPDFRSGRITEDEYSVMDDIFVRAIGYMRNVDDLFDRDLKKPLKWFKHGMSYMMSLPLHLLNSFGLVSEDRVSSITESATWKFISGLVSLLGFLGTIVTILTGWEAFKKIVGSWLH